MGPDDDESFFTGDQNMKRILITAALAAWLAGAYPAAPQSVAIGVRCGNNVTCISRGWTDSDRSDWYRMSQGSRLVPERWADALRNDDAYIAMLFHFQDQYMAR